LLPSRADIAAHGSGKWDGVPACEQRELLGMVSSALGETGRGLPAARGNCFVAQRALAQAPAGPDGRRLVLIRNRSANTDPGAGTALLVGYLDVANAPRP
jgi:hypothetical protein